MRPLYFFIACAFGSIFLDSASYLFSLVSDAIFWFGGGGVVLWLIMKLKDAEANAKALQAQVDALTGRSGGAVIKS